MTSFVSFLILQEARYEKVFKETENETDYLGRLTRATISVIMSSLIKGIVQCSAKFTCAKSCVATYFRCS